MPPLVNLGSTLQCTCGVAPLPLLVVAPTVCAESPPAANIMDHVPIVNIATFCLCNSMANPTVAAALGVPMPCTPITAMPWSPGSPTVMLRGTPALSEDCQCMCMWAGAISITKAGTTTTQVA